MPSATRAASQERGAPLTLRGATRATYVAFAGCGFAFAGWASRIPAVREHLHLTPSALGLVLLAGATGSVLALPLSGAIVQRAGAGLTVAANASLVAVALVTLSGGYLAGTPVVVVGMLLLGVGIGAWDVAMNVHGADVERRLGRSVMPRFHAAYSLGTVAGGLVGAAAVHWHVPVSAHLALVATAVGAAVPLAGRRFLQGDLGRDATTGGSADPRPHGSLAAWREPRTLLIGLCVLAFAFSEGTGNDWISVAAIDGHHVSPSLGALALVAFLTAMTVLRWFGTALLDRHGRVPVVRALAGVSLAGLLLFVLAPAPPLAYLGALLWGAGTALGFPVGMSAAADDADRAAGRVSVVSSIGYCAFLGGPPLIGFLGDRLGVLRALAAAAVLLAVGAVTSGSLRPRRSRTAGATDTGYARSGPRRGDRLG